MAGWYIRRGEKVIGPLELPQLQELVSTRQLLPTDQLAKDIAGPWSDASSTSLFDSAKPSMELQPVRQTTPLATKSENLPAVAQSPSAGKQIAKAGGVVLVTVGKGTVALGKGTIAILGAISCSLATRAQRRHELKLEKIRAQALVEAERAKQPPPPTPVVAPPPATPRPLPPAQPTTIVVSPKVVQTTIVRPPMRTFDGCVGWIVAFLLVVIGLIAAYNLGYIEALRLLMQ